MAPRWALAKRDKAGTRETEPNKITKGKRTKLEDQKDKAARSRGPKALNGCALGGTMLLTCALVLPCG